MRALAGGALALVLASAPRLQAQGALTIYQDGRVQVVREVPVQVPAGTSRARIVIDETDPGTIQSLDPDVTLLAAAYEAPSTEAEAIRQSLGQRLVFRRESGDTVGATVRSVSPLQLELDDGRVIFQSPGVPLYPAALVRRGGQLTLSLRAGRAHPRLRLGYFTDGASWRATYDAQVQGESGVLRGHVVVESAWLAADSAAIRVVSGGPSRAGELAPRQRMPPQTLAPQGRNWLDEAISVSGATNAMPAPRSPIERVGEAHTYSLPGRHTLLPGATSLLPLFEPATVRVERTYVLPGKLPDRGDAFPSQRPEENLQAVVLYSLARPPALAALPLPPGILRIYEPDSEARPTLVAVSAIDGPAPGQPVRLVAGPAYGIAISRIDRDAGVVQDTLRNPFRVVQTARLITYELVLRNTSDATVTVDVVERRSAPWSVVSSSVEPEALDKGEVRFRVRVAPRQQEALTYRVLIPTPQ